MKSLTCAKTNVKLPIDKEMNQNRTYNRLKRLKVAPPKEMNTSFFTFNLFEGKGQKDIYILHEHKFFREIVSQKSYCETNTFKGDF